jgi:hypothetical protein
LVINGYEAQDPLICLRLAGWRDPRPSINGGVMSNLFWLADAQMARFRPFLPKSHGKPRVDA